MIPADLDRYGGIKRDEFPVEDSEVCMSAAEDMRRSEDLAQLTRTPIRARLRFVTRGTNGAVTISARNTLWGDTSDFDPTGTRTAAGTYQFAWPSSFDDGLEEEETLAFLDGWAQVASATEYALCTVVVSGTTATVYLRTTGGVLTDLTADTTQVSLFVV